MHEILSLQFGHRANYVTAHYWNTQESYFTYDNDTPSPVDHHVQFRPGQNRQGEETFTPRTLIYDLKGGFGGLRKWGGLYDQQLSLEPHSDQSSSAATWDGPVSKQREPEIAQSEYQASLEQESPNDPRIAPKDVRFWSDFNRVFYHPRSIIQIYDYEHKSSMLPFTDWQTGKDLFRKMDKEEDILDHDLRPWAEECDQMQGFQVITGTEDAWAGFAAEYVERIRDEYGKSSVWVWGISQDDTKQSRVKQAVSTVNSTRLMCDLSSTASIYTPLTLPSRTNHGGFCLYEDSLWCSSAIISAAIESATLPTRLRATTVGSRRMDGLASVLNVNGKQWISRLQSKVVHEKLSAPRELESKPQDSRTRPQRQSGTKMQESVGQIEAAESSIDLSDQFRVGPYRSAEEPEGHVFGKVTCHRDRDAPLMNSAPSEQGGTNVGKADECNIPIRFPCVSSFPPIFADNTDSEIAIETVMSTSTRTYTGIRRLQKAVPKMVGIEDRETLGNTLGGIAEEYIEGWRDDSESDDDNSM